MGKKGTLENSETLEIIGSMLGMDNTHDVYNCLALRIRAEEGERAQTVLVPAGMEDVVIQYFLRDVRITARKKDNHLWLQDIQELE